MIVLPITKLEDLVQVTRNTCVKSLLSGLKGAMAMASNADTPLIRRIYRARYIFEIEAPRHISPKQAGFTVTGVC